MPQIDPQYEPNKQCRGCGGTGIGAHVSPREAQVAMQKVYMVKQWVSQNPNGTSSIGQVAASGKVRAVTDKAEPKQVYESADEAQKLRTTRAYARIDAWAGGAGPKAYSSRLSMSGSFAYVLQHIEKRLHDGFEIEPGSMMPDASWACHWCNGYGEAAGQLSVNAMESAITGGS